MFSRTPNHYSPSVCSRPKRDVGADDAGGVGGSIGGGSDDAYNNDNSACISWLGARDCMISSEAENEQQHSEPQSQSNGHSTNETSDANSSQMDTATNKLGGMHSYKLLQMILLIPKVFKKMIGQMTTYPKVKGPEKRGYDPATNSNLSGVLRSMNMEITFLLSKQNSSNGNKGNSDQGSCVADQNNGTPRNL
ncbi:hypothetical protein Tco_0285822 [Tanacetum coccineum]